MVKEIADFMKSRYQNLNDNYYYFGYYDKQLKTYRFIVSQTILEIEEKQVYGAINAQSKPSNYKALVLNSKNALEFRFDDTQKLTFNHFWSKMENEKLGAANLLVPLYAKFSSIKNFNYNFKFSLLEDELNKGDLSSKDKGFFSGLFSGLINALLSPLNLIKEAVNALGGVIGGFFKNLTSALTNLFKGLTDTIFKIFNDLKDFVLSIFIPKQDELKKVFDDFTEFSIAKLGAVGQVFDYVKRFVDTLNTYEKKCILKMGKPISIQNTQVFNINYDLCYLKNDSNLNNIYNIYYNFISGGLIFAFFGYLASKYNSIIKD